MSSGFVAAGWEPVAEAFGVNLEQGADVGAGCAVYHRGQCVIDITGGTWPDGSTAYDERTLQLVFSTTKGITATAVAMCVQRGLLAYDDPVARHWPEFAAHGKEHATVAQLLSHRCGVIAPDRALTLAEALDWETTTTALADSAPDWPIGSTHGYHALSYGWLAGELIRRTDGRDLGTFVAEEIAGPLGVDLWIGLPASQESRVSPLIPWPAPTDPTVKAMMEMFMGPTTRTGRAMTLGGAFADGGEVGADSVFNRRDVHAAQLGAANAITNAGALAKIYAATFATVDGVRLLDEPTRVAATASQTPPGETDACLMVPTVFAAGFALPDNFSPFAGPGSYGHTGAGGSVAFANPELELGFGYVMNKMDANLAADVRPGRLVAAVKQVLGRG